MLVSKKRAPLSAAPLSIVSSNRSSRGRDGFTKPIFAARLAVATAMAVGAMQHSAAAGTTYTIQRIGLISSAQSTDPTTGLPLDTNGFIYANSSGNVVGYDTLYGASAAYNSTALWFYNGNTSIPLGFTNPSDNTVNNTTGVYYQRAGSGDNNISELANTTLGNSTNYDNGYVTGVSRRFDSAGNSLGADAWIFNGNGATASTKSVAIPIPSTVIVPTSSATSPAPTGLSSSNLAYNVPSQNSPNNGGTLELMGNSTSSPSLQAGSHGNAAGLVALYYNTTGTTWAQTATDAFYFDGTTTKTIGLVNGNDVDTVGNGSNVIARVSAVTRLNTADQVLGYSTYYGGTTTGSGTGYDIWLYDPNNATGSGANGTMILAPTPSNSSNIYASGNVFPTYLTNSGIVASAYQQYASTDTARGTTLSQDAFVYNSHVTGSAAWTQVGLTGSAYTYYSNGTKSGVGGSSFGAVSFSFAPPVNESGQAVGFTKRTASPNVALGQDTWVYYPSASVPPGAVSGTTQIGLYGNGLADGTSPYEYNSGSGVFRSSTPTALTAAGAVIGTSTRYISNASSTNAGTDAWIYDPAHGITTTQEIGLYGDSIHQYTAAGATNVTRSSSITAIGSQGMVAGTSARYTSSTSSTSTGVDAWVFDPITDKTYSVDPNSPSDRTQNFASTIAYISNSGVALGYDSSTLTNTGSPAYNYQAFEWYLSYDSATGMNDIPNFEYLFSSVTSASLTASNFSALFTEPGSSLGSPSMTASGQIIGLGDLGSDSPNSYVPFQLTPSSVPEPASLAVLVPSVALLLSRRKRAIR